MKIYLVPGKTLLSDGTIPEDFVLQMEKAVRLLETTPDSRLVITGGVTQPGFVSEAEAGRTLVPTELWYRTIVETMSSSTRQNLKAVKKLLRHFQIDGITVISTRGHKTRTRYLFWRLWPEMLPRLSFEFVGPYTVRDRLAHALWLVLTVIDPGERIFLPLKKFFK